MSTTLHHHQLPRLCSRIKKQLAVSPAVLYDVYSILLFYIENVSNKVVEVRLY